MEKIIKTLAMLFIFFMLTCLYAVAQDIKELKISGSPRIILGTQVPVSDDSWKSIVALKNGSFQFCGGNLIAPKWVLTAAHCVEDAPPNMTIGAHSYNRDTTIQYTVANIIVHENYNSDTSFDNDIALIKLNEAVSNVTPIAYDTRTQNRSSGLIVKTAGWGVRDMNDDEGSTYLMEAYVPLNDRNTCNNLEYPYNGFITNNMLCAGKLSGGSGSCYGDSGGPLVANNILIGIVSWGGHPCAGKNNPGIYTNVKRYTNWIEEHMRVGENIPLIPFNKDTTGIWTVDKLSTHRQGKFAKYYQFTLDAKTEVVIDLISTVDTYMFLLEGADENGGVVVLNDDGGKGYNSKITRVLAAGTYTIEATTYAASQTGSFMLHVLKY